jgi:hypothetical protein
MRRQTFAWHRPQERFWNEAQFLKFIRPNEREIPAEQVRAARNWYTNDGATQLTAGANLTPKREFARSASA